MQNTSIPYCTWNFRAIKKLYIFLKIAKNLCIRKVLSLYSNLEFYGIFFVGRWTEWFCVKIILHIVVSLFFPSPMAWKGILAWANSMTMKANFFKRVCQSSWVASRRERNLLQSHKTYLSLHHTVWNCF